MAEGVYPSTRHDGSAWPEDQEAASNAGEELGYKAAVVMVRGDWSEYVHAFGHPSWQTHANPCLFCFCKGGENGNFRAHAGIMGLDLPWATKGMYAYEAACRASEKLARVTSEAQRDRLAQRCVWDKRKNTSGALHGRGLGW